ncbi:MAG: hypothetical protein OXU78_04110 [Deltaproteobacteria bacterium]|nr:hypothetical protein [Deltaproteobacteria bacterium]
MERTQKTWLLEIVLAAILAALVGIAGWTATKVIENGERIIEVKAELQKEIAENGKKIAALDAKMDLLIRGLNISVTPKESASAETSGAESGGFQIGAGGTATE